MIRYLRGVWRQTWPLLVLIAACATFSFTIHHQENAVTCAYRCQGNDDNETWTILGVVATGFIAVFALWQVMESRLSNERQLRAYVAAVPHFITAFDEYSPPKISVKLLNVGATPALCLQHRVQIELLPHPYKKGMELAPTSGSFGPPMALFPHTEFFGYRLRAQCFTADEIADIRAEKARIYI